MRGPLPSLQSLKFRSFVEKFRAESAALWLLCLYIFMEYIRPQGMYPVLDVLPWGQLAILSCVVSVFITGNRPNGFGAMDKMFVAISVLVILSGIFAWNPAEALKHWTIYTSWLLMYFCIVSVLTTPNRILLFTLFFILINFKLSQHGARTFAARGFSFAGWGLAGSPGWFENSGEFTLQMVVMFAMSVSMLIALREDINSPMRWWILLILFPGTAAISVIGASSRGGQIALAAVLMVLLLKGRYLLRGAALLSIIVWMSLYFLPTEEIARFDTMGDDETSQLRLMHWERAIEVLKSNPWGIGYKNWIPYYEAHYDVKSVEEIHNTVLQAFVELGYSGGTVFLLMVLASFLMNSKTSREMASVGGAEGRAVAAIATGVNLGLLGTFIAALFMSVLYYPVFWLAFALTSALRHISQRKMAERRTSVRSRNETRWVGGVCKRRGIN
jgi:putative inorganic carbon (HCO3(-)) transporter